MCNMMVVLRLGNYCSLFWIPLFLAIFQICGCNSQQHSSEDYLVLGNNALSEDANAIAVDLYEKGIDAAHKDTDNTRDMYKSLVTVVSLETNLATAYSAMEGMEQKAMEHYEKAIQAYSEHQTSTAAIENDDHDNYNNSVSVDDAMAIVSQTAFFYGMELHEIDAGRAVEMYGRAVLLDPELWAAWANLGACVCALRFVLCALLFICLLACFV
jgi:tetratricopeptide (TPR) repeat protein